MIIVVEGVSAAGKTHWCERHASIVVPELPPMVPPNGDAVAVARFWTEACCRRWQEAVKGEQTIGSAYCDTDPLKLHYPWCLWQLGFAKRETWCAAVAETRAAIEDKSMGFADAVVFLEPDFDVVRRQKEADPNRQRRNFETHLQIGPALRKWYEFLERLSPGRVRWHAEREGALPLIPCQKDRFSLQLFDALVAVADVYPR